MSIKVPGLAPHSAIFCLSLLLAASSLFQIHSAAAQDLPPSLPQPTWDRDDAVQAAEVAAKDTAWQQQLSHWQQQAETGQAAALLAELQQAAQTPDPAFEAGLQRLAIGLAEAPLDAEIDALLQWLAQYRSTVLVAHEESADHGVALFPVAAAASGALAERERQRAQHVSAAELANSLTDAHEFLQAYQSSQGAYAPQLLREAAWRLDATQRNALLQGAMSLADTSKAALAISMLAPELYSNTDVSQQLLALLGDPELGASAALALAGHPDPEVQARLQQLSRSNGLKAQRAALALDRSISERHEAESSRQQQTTDDPQ